MQTEIKGLFKVIFDLIQLIDFKYSENNSK